MCASRKAPDVLIVGGGAIGLALARRLLAGGAEVTVVERDRPGRSATWAAGGMLAPLGEAPEPGAFLDAGVESLGLWPDFADELHEESGLDLRFRRTGKLVAALDETGFEELRERERWMREAGFAVELLDGTTARGLEPTLAPTVLGALGLSSDSHVDNRRLGPALAASVEGRGGRILTGTGVERIRIEGSRAAGVRLTDGVVLDAGTVVVAAGAWSAGLDPTPTPPPVRPVRGQMLRLRLSRIPGRLLAGPGAYLIPFPEEGELVVGATEEEAGFRIETEEDDLERLHRAAAALLPAAADAPRIEAWAGLRPGSGDDLPILGADPRVEGLFWATGHFRNGILLTPYTAEVLAECLSGGGLPARARAFSPERFLVLSGSGS